MDAKISTEQFVDYLFDHPVTNPEWYWDIDAPYLVIEPEQAALLIAEIFENASALLSGFSNEQLRQGLWYLLSSACSDYMIDAVASKEVDCSRKVRVMRSIVLLFKTAMVARCSQHLSHNDEPGADALNGVCYMWWDIMQYWDHPELPGRRVLDMEALSAMQQILAIPHDACRESALHGLGHIQASYPEEVVSIIDQWLSSEQGVRDELRQYAANAKDGMVL